MKNTLYFYTDALAPTLTFKNIVQRIEECASVSDTNIHTLAATITRVKRRDQCGTQSEGCFEKPALT